MRLRDPLEKSGTRGSHKLIGIDRTDVSLNHFNHSSLSVTQTYDKPLNRAVIFTDIQFYLELKTR